MKKALAMLLAVTLTAALAGCGKKDESSSKTDTAAQTTTVAAADPADASQSAETPDESSAAETILGPLEPGKLFIFPLEEGEQQVLRNVRLAGNQVGTAEFNAKDPSERVRCIFDLDEWVEIYPDTDAESGLKCWVFRHKDDPAFYRDNPLSDETEGYVQSLDLNKNPDDENGYWGSFYIFHEENEQGLYDLVFTCNGKPVGALLTKFYNEMELNDKSDEELEEIMKGILS